MKQNSCSTVGEVAKSSGVGFDELNRAIESFGAGVDDSVPTVVEQTRLMPSEHLDHFLIGSSRLRIALLDHAPKKRLAAPV